MSVGALLIIKQLSYPILSESLVQTLAFTLAEAVAEALVHTLPQTLEDAEAKTLQDTQTMCRRKNYLICWLTR